MGMITTPDEEVGWVKVRSEKVRVSHQQPSTPPGSVISTKKGTVEGSKMLISMTSGVENDQFGMGGCKCDVGSIEMGVGGCKCDAEDDQFGVGGCKCDFGPVDPTMDDQLVRAADGDRVTNPPLEMPIGTDGSESDGGPLEIDPFLLELIGTYCPAVLRMNPPFYVAKSDNRNDQLAQPSHKKPRCD